MSGRITQVTAHFLDRIGDRIDGWLDSDWLISKLGFRRRDRGPKHLRTGRRGEEEAYFHLRQAGYTIVARNYRSSTGRGELDMVGWEGGVLCFIEVKTRSSRNFLPAEAAVDGEKRRALSRTARAFLRKIRGSPPVRFDVVSVYLEPGRPAEIVVFKSAFAMT